MALFVEVALEHARAGGIASATEELTLAPSADGAADADATVDAHGAGDAHRAADAHGAGDAHGTAGAARGHLSASWTSSMKDFPMPKDAAIAPMAAITSAITITVCSAGFGLSTSSGAIGGLAMAIQACSGRRARAKPTQSSRACHPGRPVAVVIYCG
jgi:hypothetical protein